MKNNNNQPNIAVIVGSITGGLVIIGVSSLFAYKWYQRRKEFKSAIPTGSASDANR